MKLTGETTYSIAGLYEIDLLNEFEKRLKKVTDSELHACILKTKEHVASW